MNTHEKVREFLQGVVTSKKSTIVKYIILVVFVIMVAFQLGFEVGLRKGFYFNAWNNQYRENITRTLPATHGTVGKIIAINFPNITVLDTDATEKIIVIKSDTAVRTLRESITADQLVVGNEIIVIGTPNGNGSILANLIRVLPNEIEMETKE